MNFDYWMTGGPGITVDLQPQSFFIDYDDTDTSFKAFGKTYGPQRRPGDPYTMRPFLAVFQRRGGTAWVADDFMANFVVRYWDYELGYVTTARADAGVGLCPQFLGEGAGGELRYSFSWMQSVGVQVIKPKADDQPLMLAGFNEAPLSPAVPLFRLRSGYDESRSQWYLAPLAPEGHRPPEPALFNISFRSSMRMLSAVLQTQG